MGIDGHWKEAKRRGWPLTVQEILKERIEFEDQVLHRDDPVPAIPKQKVEKKVRWSAAARAAFRREVRLFIHL